LHATAFRFPEGAVPFPPNLTAQTHLVLFSPAQADAQRLAPLLRARGEEAATGQCGVLMRELPTAPPVWDFLPAAPVEDSEGQSACEAAELFPFAARAQVRPLPADSPLRPFFMVESLRVAEVRQIASMCVAVFFSFLLCS
jgi:hypothetical protein